MHFFALFLFMALGVVTLVMLGERGYRRLHEGRAFFAGAWGVGLAWLANFNMWTGFGIAHLRFLWVGVTLTGLALGGTALLLSALLGFFMGLYRKFDDQAEQIERNERNELHKVA